MASVYGYTTVAVLESYCGKDFGNIDAAYTDAVVEVQISQAEYHINLHTGTSYTGVIPGAIVIATLELARFFMYRLLVEDEYLNGAVNKDFEDVSTYVKYILDMYNSAEIEGPFSINMKASL